MRKISEKIVFFGNERLATGVTTAAPVLRALVAGGYDVEAVIANHTDPVSHQKRDLEIGILAHSFGIPVILTGKTIPLEDKVEKHRAEAAVLVAFGKIVPQSVIDLFPKGIINVHPSLLPKLRGSTPIETAILDNLSETGVTLMRIAAEMDAGPIYAQEKLALSGHEDKSELSEKLSQLGANLLTSHLPAILDGSLKPKAQDGSQATYTKLINKEDGVIDWSKSAERLEREIRAYAEWPKSRTELAGKEVILTKARVVEGAGKPGEVLDGRRRLVIGTGNQALEVLSLKPAGKSEMTAQAFLAGNDIR